MRAAVLSAIVIASARVASADDALEVGFREAAQQVATLQDRFVVGWGTPRLDGSRRPHFFATLMPRNEGRGAYLIEQAPDAWWLVTFFNEDGRTDAFVSGGVDPETSTVPWTVSTDTAIAHEQGHRHGGETLSFGLRGTELVLLTYVWDDDVTSSRGRQVVHHYARGAAPLLAAAYTRDSRIAVAGPVRVPTGLIEAKSLPLHIDFDRVAIASDADALAMWKTIGVTGEDLDKLDSIPDGPIQVKLAVAALHADPTGACATSCIATCVRHAITLWALQRVSRDPDQYATISDALHAIVTSPASPRDLVDTALGAVDNDPEHARASSPSRRGARAITTARPSIARSRTRPVNSSSH